MKKVIKRDGTEQRYNSAKIQVAIGNAMKETFPGDSRWDKSSLEVMQVVDEKLKHSDGPFDIEFIQDLIERALMKQNFPRVAKAYILYRSKHAELRELDPDPKAISDYIHASKYAQYIPELGRREIFEETVTRSRSMHIERFPDLTREICDKFAKVYEKRVLPSMRSMQFGGKAVAMHEARMYNCSFTLIDRPRVFQEIFYLLLCGCGVGYSVQKQHVAKLDKVGEPNTDNVLIHHVEDTIEGWADAVGLLMSTYQNNMYFEPCYDLIRPRGSDLKTSGGKAPGHLPLKKLIRQIREIMDNAIGRRLRPLECHDLVCFIAEAVLAGGVRRSSLIALFSKDDDEMLSCKTHEHFNYQGLNTQRSMANNSVVLLRHLSNKEEFMQVMKLNKKSFGEPGFMFTNNLDHGTNPCGEIGIDPTTTKRNGLSVTGFGFCNLCEVNVAACKSEAEFFEACKAAAFIGTLQASYTDFPYLGEATKKIVERDALLGVGLVGIMDNPTIGLCAGTLKEGAQIVIRENIRVAQLIGINPAARCTTVKPSGTSSLELGCVGSGIHPHHSHRYFRRITANNNEPVAKYFAKINPHMVETKPNGDLCLTFPVKAPKNSIVISDLNAITFMDYIFKVYDSWILNGNHGGFELTHNISSTVVVKEGEWDKALEYAWSNKGRIRSMSFFPEFGDKKIPFAPREEVTAQDESRWKNLVKNYTPVNYESFSEKEDATNRAAEPACSGDSCEIVHVDSVSQADGTIYTTDPNAMVPDIWLFRGTPLEIGGIKIWEAKYDKPTRKTSMNSNHEDNYGKAENKV